jgi:tRNA A-37 threonylcarbamoyl transferase component Bud32
VEAALARAGAARLHENARRLLLRADLEGFGSVAIKRFRADRHLTRERLKRALGRSPAEREWRALRALHAAGAAVPEPLALARVAGGDAILVLRFVAGVPLAQALGAGRQRRAAILESLGRAVAEVHAAGFAHGDLHAGNVLVADGRAVLLDLQHARRLRGPADRLRDLGRLDYSLWRLVNAPARLRVRRAALALLDPRDPAAREELRAVGRTAQRRADAHARSRTRRSLRSRRLVAAVRGAGFAGWRLRELAEADLEAALAAHRGALARGGASRLKADARSRVSAVAAGARRVVVKEFGPRGLCRALADRVRGSPARRAWLGGHGLRARGLGAPLPLACLERRRLGLPLASLVVLEDLRPAPDALAALERAPEPTVAALTRLLVALHRRGVDHGDLKATHVFLTDRGRAALVDLEGVRFPRRLREARRRRALAELNASLPDAFPAEWRCRAFRRYARELPFGVGNEAALREVVRESLARRHRFRGEGCRLAEEIRASRR